MTSRLARAVAVGAMATGAVAVVTAFGAPGGAQTDASTVIDNDGVDRDPAMSHDGRTIAFVTSPGSNVDDTSLVIHERGPLGPDGAVLPATTTPVADSLGATNPAISGDGCIVSWSIPAVADPVAPEARPSVESDPDTDNASDPEAPADGASDAQISDGQISDGPVDGDPGEPAGSDAGNEGSSASPTEPVDGEVAGLQAGPARVVVLDRCVDTVPGGTRIELATTEGDLSFGPAAMSFDGSVLAVSNGTDVIRFERGSGGDYVEAGRFDGADTDATDHLVASRVDVSDDGSVVVFAAGLDLADTSSMTVFAAAQEAGDASTSPVLTSSTDPGVSGDGTLVVGASGPDGSTVAIVDRTSAPLVPADLGPGRRPSISADGNHVVFEEGANLAVVSRTGQGDGAFTTTERTPLATTVAPTRSGPIVDRHGATVVSDEPFDANAASPIGAITVTAVGADAGFDAATFDLGSGDIGAALTSTVTFSNRGPASVGVAGIEVDGTFTIAEERCGTVIRPGTTCEIDVSFVVERLEDAFGVVTLTPTAFDVPAFTANVVALGEAPPASTPMTTTTTRPTSSTGGTTGGTTTGRTTGSTTGRTSRGTTTTGGSRGTTSTGGSRSTTTTVAPGAGVSASPTAFEFAPTIIDAGRRTGLVEIVNNGTGAVNVVGVGLEPIEAGPFQIVETTCADQSIAVGARCEITLSFAPTEVGPQSVSLIATLEGGVDITVPVTGTGAPVPIVNVVPGVATIGQVVTLSGAGFPTGIAVDVEWGSSTRRVEVDEAGTFNVPVVVMQHTSTGPAAVSVAGQVDMFDDVVATMLVTHTSDRSSPSVIDGIGPSIGR